jgi:hypothetical protein
MSLPNLHRPAVVMIGLGILAAFLAASKLNSSVRDKFSTEGRDRKNAGE